MEIQKYNTYADLMRGVRPIYVQANKDSENATDIESATPSMRLAISISETLEKNLFISLMCPFVLNNGAVIDGVSSTLGDIPKVVSSVTEQPVNKNEGNGGVGVMKPPIQPFFRTREGLCDTLMQFMNTVYFIMRKGNYNKFFYIAVDMGRRFNEGPFSIYAFETPADMKQYYNMNVATLYPYGPFKAIQ